MPDAHHFALFALASLAILAFPGPSVLFIVARSLEHGRRAGLASMLGVQAGGLVHVFAATAGVSAILASSSTAFSVVRYAGAAYLIFLGVICLRRREMPGVEVQATGAPPDGHHARLFRQGVLVNVLNPKVTVFFLAFLPQFADESAGPIAPQLLALGLLYAALALLSDGSYALLAGTLGDRLKDSARLRARVERASGMVYLGLGAAAALTGHRR